MLGPCAAVIQRAVSEHIVSFYFFFLSTFVLYVQLYFYDGCFVVCSLRLETRIVRFLFFSCKAKILETKSKRDSRE